MAATLPGQSAIDQIFQKRQYVPDQVINTVAIAVAPATEALVARASKVTELPKWKPPQYVPDILENAILPTPQPAVMPFIALDLPTLRPIKPQFIPDQLFNPVALKSGGIPTPFLPTSTDQAGADQQFIADQGFNPQVPGAGGAATPFIPTSSADSFSDNPFIPDQVINPIALPAGQPPPVQYGQSAQGQLYPKKQYVPDVLTNPVALGVVPSTEFLIGRDVQWDPVFPPWKRFVPDVLENPILPFAARPPFVPAFIEQPRPHAQYIPDQVLNSVVFTVPAGAELLVVERDTFPVDPPFKRYVPDILFNPVALPLSPPPPAPFNPGLNEQPKAGKQFVPDQLSNPVALATGFTAPFNAFVTPPFPAGRQFSPDVLSNPIVPTSSQELVPFHPAFIEQPRGTRQFVPDVGTNPQFPAPPPPPPIIPPVIPPVIPPSPPLPPTIPPPTQASSRTVSSISIPYLQVVMDLDPAFQRDKHRELFYPFGEAGHRARDFYGDPYASGAYASTQPGSPTETVLPAISGAPVVTMVLSASIGTWTGSPASFVFRWFRNGVAIVGATLQTYLLTIPDGGTIITVGVTAINGFGHSSEIISAPVGPVKFLKSGDVLTASGGGILEDSSGGIRET